MEYKIMSRSQAIDYSMLVNEPTAIVSITFHGRSPATFAENNNIAAILHEEFDDVSAGTEGCITSEQAREIAQFAKKVYPNVDSILVHCDAGQSRSAGVCAALMKFFEGDDSIVFNNPRFTPNFCCYDNVLRALVV